MNSYKYFKAWKMTDQRLRVFSVVCRGPKLCSQQSRQAAPTFPEIHLGPLQEPVLMCTHPDMYTYKDT